MQTKLSSFTEKQQFWLGHIEIFKKSGLSRKEYCDRHGLELQHMSYFAAYVKKKVGRQNRNDGFIKLTPDPPVVHLTMRLTNGISIEFPSKSLQDVLRSLREIN